MDKQEAQALVREHLHIYRARSYDDLTTMLGNLGCVEVAGPSPAFSRCVAGARR
jgi:hypothetical protein